MSEIFGRENHVATIPYRTGYTASTKMIPEIGNWLVWFTKDKPKASTKYHQLYEKLDRKQTIRHMTWHAMCELPDSTCRNLTNAERDDPNLLPEGARVFRRMPLVSSHTSTTGRSKPFEWEGDQYPCPAGNQWSVSHEGLQNIATNGRMVITDNKQLTWKRYASEIPGRQISVIWNDVGSQQHKQYVVETPPKILERCLLMTTNPGDLILDLTCGSGAMPYQAERWGRRWIAVDVAQVSIAITRGTPHH